MSKNKSKFRMIQQSFWSDPKVVEEFTPEDKLIFLYLMTNQLTTQIGIYPITRKHIAYETGYSTESIKAIMDRFINNHKIIKYDEESREVFILNWGKHNYRTGGKPIEDLVRSELSTIKNKDFIKEASRVVPSESIKKIFLEFCDDESYHESCDESYDDTGYEKENKKENKKEELDPVVVALQFYEKNISFMMSTFERDAIEQDVEEFGSDMLVHAMGIAIKSGARNYRYIEGILKKWRVKGINTMDQVIASENQHTKVQTKEASKPSVPVDEHEMMKEMGF